MKQLLMLSMAIMLMAPAMVFAQADVPITTDSRIKTFVYNENDVFSVLTHYGYQSNVEFGRGESVVTVSVGDRVAWQIIPSGRRLFIKALEENAHTNMTVVTNKRAYQFDLRASGKEPLHPSEELVYVVRFFYPEEQSAVMPSAHSVMPVAASQPVYESAAALNYYYTYAGPDQVAPIKIYDDGRATYFRFNNPNAAPQFYVIGLDGSEQPVQAMREANGDISVAMIAPRFSVKQQGTTVSVFNERFSSQPAM